MAPPVVDSCTEAMYLDRTAEGADRDLAWSYSFAGDAERCLIVRVGQRVVWHGNFGDHPLESDQGDRPNPIDGHQSGVVTFDRPGVFGYRCNFHLEMRGAVWVLPALAPAPVPASSLPIGVGGAFLLLAIAFVASRRTRRGHG